MKYGVVHLPKPGKRVSGDAYLFLEDTDSTLVALIDGLGSGEAANLAATRAQACVASSSTAPLIELLKRCHQALHGTRGAVMMLMRVNRREQKVSFAGVGNIGVRVFSDLPINPISRNGIVGYRMTSVQEFSYPYMEGDVFVLHSDGVSTRFQVEEKWVCSPSTDPQDVADEIVEHYGKDNDDVTLLVVR